MDKKFELTLLTEDEVLGRKKLAVLKEFGTKCVVSDLAIITGCERGQDFPRTEIDNYRIGEYYTQSFKFDEVAYVDYEGKINLETLQSRNCAIRPVLRSPEIFDQIFKNRRKKIFKSEVVYLGEYPQQVADSMLYGVLEWGSIRGDVKKTGRTYTFMEPYDDNSKELKPVTHEEYEFDGKRYVRVKIDSNYTKLSDRVNHKNGSYTWIKVLPVAWLSDDKTKTLISTNGLLSGIRFNAASEFNGNFANTEMKHYLDNYMVKDIFQSVSLFKEEIEKANTNDNNSIKINTNILSKENSLNRIKIEKKQAEIEQLNEILAGIKKSLKEKKKELEELKNASINFDKRKSR